MEFRFFAGEGPEAAKLIEEAKQEAAKVSAARTALQNEYGARALLVHGNGRAFGLVFKEKPDLKFIKPAKVDLEGHCYVPKKNSKAGKELAEKLKSNDLVFSWSDFLVRKTNSERYAVDTRARLMYQTSAGFMGNTVLLRIPAAMDKYSNDPFPALPEWFREIKESEFLAIQGR